MRTTSVEGVCVMLPVPRVWKAQQDDRIILSFYNPVFLIQFFFLCFYTKWKTQFSAEFRTTEHRKRIIEVTLTASPKDLLLGCPEDSGKENSLNFPRTPFWSLPMFCSLLLLLMVDALKVAQHPGWESVTKGFRKKIQKPGGSPAA